MFKPSYNPTPHVPLQISIKMILPPVNEKYEPLSVLKCWTYQLHGTLFLFIAIPFHVPQINHIGSTTNNSPAMYYGGPSCWIIKASYFSVESKKRSSIRRYPMVRPSRKMKLPHCLTFFTLKCTLCARSYSMYRFFCSS